MRRIATLIILLLGLGGLLTLARQVQSQPQQRRDSAPDRTQRRQRSPGPPAPPILVAIDKDGDGEISASEWKNASTALRTLDKNRDGDLTDEELIPEEFRRGGRSRGGPPGFGRGGGRFGGGPAGPKLNPDQLEFRDGVAKILDHATYHRLSYRGEEVMIDTFLADLEFVKFTLDEPESKSPKLYFINTKTHRAHMMFARVAGLPFGRGGEQMKGVLVFRPMLKSPSGSPGLYTFEFEPFDAYSFSMVKRAHDELIKHMPILKGNIGYFPRGEGASARVESERELYKKAGLPIYYDKDLTNTDVAYLPLNPGESFGRLRVMKLGERPSPRDVVLYRSLPNEMPRVAGIITGVRQTPLSHVNLRAVQDKIPNAFIAGAETHPQIKPLIGKLVAYSVTKDGFSIRAAGTEELEKHFAKRRPKSQQTPERDLTQKSIQGLDELGFKNSSSVGVKAANLAAMRKFGFPSGTVPVGYAIPFYYYDEFMKHNGFYNLIKDMMKSREFQQGEDQQVAALKKLRSLIKKGKMPGWMLEELDKLHKRFPAGTSLRCRSSTNNEDLPGYSGAGLYDSYTHKPDEGHLSKSVKQVFASTWNYRAFEEREFYRVDHFRTAMAVLVHPNYKGERANGVAVTDDILYQTEGHYYLNTQIGEDLVTNPDQASIPEEVLLDWTEKEFDQVMRRSNRSQNRPLLRNEHIEQLRKHLGQIHAKFAKLYGKSLEDPRFAMEVEFKITKDRKLVIKQARPWVYTQN